MNEHIEWLMAHASFSYGETEEASQSFHHLVKYIERLKRTIAEKDKYISDLVEANEEEGHRGHTFR